MVYQKKLDRWLLTVRDPDNLTLTLVENELHPNMNSIVERLKTVFADRPQYQLSTASLYALTATAATTTKPAKRAQYISLTKNNWGSQRESQPNHDATVATPPDPVVTGTVS